MEVPLWLRGLWLNYLYPVIGAAISAALPLIFDALTAGVALDTNLLWRTATMAVFGFLAVRFDPRNGTNPTTGRPFPWLARKVDAETGKFEDPKDSKPILPPDPTPAPEPATKRKGTKRKS